MRPFAIAGVQMHVSDKNDNVGPMERDLLQLLHDFPWVQMIVFSELAQCGHRPDCAEPLPSDVERRFCELARKHRVWLVPGSTYELDGEDIYNTAVVIDPQGEVVARYRKMFPFLPYERDVSWGLEPCVFDVPGVGRFGLSICYDMWFPETTRAMVALGAEVILHPTLTDTLDRDVELAIVRATAATNQCYVIDVNGVGDGGVGRSTLVGPSGDVLHLAGTSPEDMPLEIDLDRVRRSREVGLRGLGQPLKSFRDRRAQFPLYFPGTRSPYLDSLGALAMPERGTRAGLDGAGHPATEAILEHEGQEGA